MTRDSRSTLIGIKVRRDEELIRGEDLNGLIDARLTPIESHTKPLPIAGASGLLKSARQAALVMGQSDVVATGALPAI